MTKETVTMMMKTSPKKRTTRRLTTPEMQEQALEVRAATTRVIPAIVMGQHGTTEVPVVGVIGDAPWTSIPSCSATE